MHPSIIPVVDRLRQDVGETLQPDVIRDACREAGYSWRNRKLDPVATVSLFLLQILHGNPACQHVVQFGQWAFSATAYCQARMRLPLQVLQILVATVAAKLRSATAEGANWLGHRVWIIDGSEFSMPDVPELQNYFGSPSGQRPGCGFPVGHWVALFDLATGMLLRVTPSPIRTHDMSQAAHVACELIVRELRYRVETPGFRVRDITLATTLLNPLIYPKSELAELYRRRWRIELDIRHLKTTMKMDILHCKTVDGVMKELAMFALAYNVVISVMVESARIQKVTVERMSFLDALRWLTHSRPGGDPGDILVNPHRPNRIEPRVIKRRMKEYPLMKEPRSVLRNRLLGNDLAVLVHAIRDEDNIQHSSPLLRYLH
jgi:hypothetical protein